MQSRVPAPRPLSPLLRTLLLFSLAPALFAGQSLLRDAEEANVNQRYTVESVSFAGTPLAQVDDSRLPPDLRDRLAALIGQRCDTAMLDAIATDLRKQLRLRAVEGRLTKGTAPDEVRVNFEIVRRDSGFEVSLPKFLYHSKQGFSGEVDATLRYRRNSLLFGVVSNGDDLAERYSGITARLETLATGPAKVHGEALFEMYHEQWNTMTLSALRPGGPALYRSRWNFAPGVSFNASRPVVVTLGASFQHTESEVPGEVERLSAAATLDVKATHRIENGSVHHQLEGRYSLRLATRALGSSYVYARHLVTLRYLARSGKHSVSNELMAGSITGDAPFFERFVLGSSSTLRGWDRYRIDPLGGSRVVHNEISYSYRVGEGSVETFYDSGALWQDNWAVRVRHSLGAGYRRGVFVATIAFPLRGWSVEPVFMAGMNY